MGKRRGKKAKQIFEPFFCKSNKCLSSIEKPRHTNIYALFSHYIKSRCSFLLILLLLSLPGHHILLFPSCSWQCRFDSAFPDFQNSLLLILSASLTDGCWGGSRDTGLAWTDWLDILYVLTKPYRLHVVLLVLFLCLSHSSPRV